jgi:predicted DCC family thiol-disulfide oxidoreductase YuxK
MAHRLACTVYFDGSCPVCSREIATYRRLRGGESVVWIDASACEDAALRGDLDRGLALQRLHVRRADGTLVSGAAAFVELWRQLPAFVWLARICSIRPLLAVLEVLYVGFLRIRRLWRPPTVPSCHATSEKPMP